MFSSLITKVTKPFTLSSNHSNIRSRPNDQRRSGDRLEDGFLLVGDTASERTTVRATQFSRNPVDCPPSYGDVTEGDTLPSYSQYTASAERYSPLTDSMSYSGFTFQTPLQAVAPTVQTGASNNGYGNQYGNPASTLPPTVHAGACNVTPGSQYGNPTQIVSPTLQVSVSQNQRESHFNNPDSRLVASPADHTNNSTISDVPFVVSCDISVVATLRDIRESNLLQLETFNACNYTYDFDIEYDFLREYGVSRNGDMDVQYYDELFIGNG